MINRSTYVLLILFLGGLLALWGADRFGVPTGRDEALSAGMVLRELFRMPLSDVRRIEIAGAGKPAVAFERRDGDRWQMVEPVDALADRGRVEALLSNLKDLRKSADAGAVKGAPATYGLDRPRTVRLFGSDRSTPLATLDVGGARLLKDLRYVRPPGRSIEVVDALPLASVDLSPPEWRQRSLFTLSTFEISRLQVGGPGRALQARRDGGKWRLLAPIRAPGDSARFDGVLADLAALRVEDGDQGFVADGVRDWARYGLDRPRITLEIAAGPEGKAETQAVQIGEDVDGRDDRAYARRVGQDEVVLVNPKPLRDLGKEPNALRSQKVADLNRDRVEFVAVRAGDLEHDLARTPAGWVVVRREGDSLRPLGKADPQLVQTLLSRLDTLQTSDFLDPRARPDAGLDHPSLTVQAWEGRAGADGTPERPAPPRGTPALDLTLGRHDAGARTVYARSAGDPATLLALPDSILDAFPAGPLAYRDRTILAQDRFAFDRFLVRRDGQEFALQAPAAPRPGPDAFTHWRMTKPVQAPADAESVARLAVLLSALRAEAPVSEADTDLKPYGLDAPPLSVSWTRRAGPGPQERTLSVGGELPGGKGSRYAIVSGDPRVFTLPAKAVEFLRAEFRDRRMLEFPLDQVKRLVLSWPGRSIALRRDPKSPAALPAWLAEPGTDVSGFEVARVNTLLESLAHLKADRFVQDDGPFPASSGLSAPTFSVQVFVQGEGTPRTLRLGAPGPPLGPEPTRFATATDSPPGPVALLSGPLWGIWAEPPAPDLPGDVFAPGP